MRSATSCGSATRFIGTISLAICATFAAIPAVSGVATNPGATIRPSQLRGLPHLESDAKDALVLHRIPSLP